MLPRRAIAPEVVAGLARRQRQAVAGRERAVGARAAGAREHQHVVDVDEGQRRHARDDVLHQTRETFGVVDHAHCALPIAALQSHHPDGRRRGRIVLAETDRGTTLTISDSCMRVSSSAVPHCHSCHGRIHASATLGRWRAPHPCVEGSAAGGGSAGRSDAPGSCTRGLTIAAASSADSSGRATPRSCGSRCAPPPRRRRRRRPIRSRSDTARESALSSARLRAAAR